MFVSEMDQYNQLTKEISGISWWVIDKDLILFAIKLDLSTLENKSINTIEKTRKNYTSDMLPQISDDGSAKLLTKCTKKQDISLAPFPQNEKTDTILQS